MLEVVSGATADEMERIGATARQLGADVSLPGISAADAAVAMNELAKAGLSVQDTVGGAEGVLQLAAAGELAVRDAAALAGGALNAFGLEGERASQVADLLAGASIAAQGEVSDMGLALQQSGAVARQAGLSIEQTVGAIALLAKNGILGSDAGTSLRTMLLRLIPTTKEAKQFTQALGIEFDETKTTGEQLPEIFEQYRNALGKLSPALQQAALTQIFGTDAIRAASIFAREGAEGYEAMTNSVNRTGAANELATARTQGLSGQFEGLKSQLTTLAQTVGEEVIPALTDIVSTSSEVVGAVTNIIDRIRELNATKVEDVFGDLPGFGGQDDANNDDDDLGRLAGPIGFLTDKINALVGYEDDLKSLRDTMSDLRPPDIIDRAQAVNDARIAGTEVGNQFGSSLAQGVMDTAALAVSAARATAQAVAAEGRAAIAQAIASAQQNLSSLGAQLAADAGQIIDVSVEEGVGTATARGGAAVSSFQRRRQQEAIRKAEAELALAIKNIPIMREIERIQRQLDRANQTDAQRDVRRGLRDAQEELAAAQRQAQTAGPLDARQVAARSRFLRPFVEEVQDAKAEVRKFNLETKLDRLQKRLDDQTDDITENIERLRDAVRSARESLIQSQQSFATGGLTTSLKSAAQAQKEAVQRGVADAIQAFNDGLITLPELNRRLAKVLEDNGVDYKNAGAKLGTAFVRGFEETLKGIGVQARDILGGPQDPGAGLRPRSVVPAEVARTARLNNEQAQRALQEALVTQGATANDELRRIREAVEGTKGGRPVTVRGESAADKAATTSSPGRPSTSAPTQPAKPRRRLKDPPE